MKITWYGTASVLLETECASLLFDPFMKALPEGHEAAVIKEKRRIAFQKQKNILITHGHLDHLSSIAELYADVPCKIYLTETPKETLCAQGVLQEKLCLIRPGDELRFGDVMVQVLQGKHVKYDLGTVLQLFSRVRSISNLNRMIDMARMNRIFRENGETLLFEIHVEGKLIQLMGSAELAEGVPYRTGADVLILPHQGRSDMDRHNRIIVEKLRPKRILVDHYDDTFPPVSTDVPVEEFCRQMSQRIPTEKLREGVCVTI